MLCKINATVGGATDEKARAINFLRAIQAICTAPAGSTPSVASVTTPTASPSIGTSGSADVITSVISNTEAGGWTSSASTTITSNYNASYSDNYIVDLYRDSGKATYPYRKLSFRTNPTQLFSESYSSYPAIGVSHGYNTSTDASGNYLLGRSSWYDTDYGGVTNRYKFDVNYYNDSGGNHAFRPAAGEWLIASTERYFIAMSGGLGSTGLPGMMMYVGLRTTNGWEDQYDDNPPLASVVYDGTYNYNVPSGSNSSMWARTMQTTGVVNSLPAWYRVNNIAASSINANPSPLGYNVDPMTGWMGYTGGSAGTYTTNPQYFWGNEMQIPMLPGGPGIMRSKQRENSVMTGPVSDPVTGTLVPPAFPISFARYKQNSNNSGGNAIGLYKSMGGTDTFMQQYYTPGQTFVVNSEAYYAYAIGNDTIYRDLFLVRKA
jgi:hypothetical protein